MATLEDKLLGEKLEYYCSSSEGEEAEDDDGDEKTASSRNQGAVGYTDPDVCPPAPPAGGYRANTGSVNTGPKGVVEDWQRFKKMQAEKRQEDERQMLELAKKLSMTTESNSEAEKRKKDEEFFAELEELESEEFLQAYQRQRMAEMLSQCGHNEQFGKVLQLSQRHEFLECLEKANKHTTIIIHIYDRSEPACATLNKCLDTLAADYPALKIAKICSSVAGMSRDFQLKGLPALLVYKAQALIGNFVRITEELSDDFFPSDVESFLIEHGIIVDKNLYN